MRDMSARIILGVAGLTQRRLVTWLAHVLAVGRLSRRLSGTPESRDSSEIGSVTRPRAALRERPWLAVTFIIALLGCFLPRRSGVSSARAGAVVASSRCRNRLSIVLRQVCAFLFFAWQGGGVGSYHEIAAMRWSERQPGLSTRTGATMLSMLPTRATAAVAHLISRQAFARSGATNKRKDTAVENQ